MSSNHRFTATALIAAVVFGAPAFGQSPAAGLEQGVSGATQRATRTARAGAAAPGTVVVQTTPARQPCRGVTVDPPMHLTLGKSVVIPLNFELARIVVETTSRAGAPEPAPQAGTPGTAGAPARAPSQAGQASDGVADIRIEQLSRNELFIHSRKTGSKNVILQGTDGRCVIKDFIVTVDPQTLQAKLTELMPEETGIRVRGADTSLVLTGTISDAVKLNNIMSVAASYGDPKKVVNLMHIAAPQQVMLEVKIAEVSKTLLDRFGLDFSRLVTSADGMKSSVISGIIGGGAGLLGRFQNINSANAVGGAGASSVGNASSSSSASLGSTQTTIVQNPDGTFSRRITFQPGTISKSASLLGVNAEKQDGIVRILAEPNIMAISGQPASFLSGGKIFIPVAQNRDGGGTTITLEEKEFGVGLKFTPTVLSGNRINLKIASEASELSQTGSPFTTLNGVTAVLPSMSTRRMDTTVQLTDGQSFVVAGLIKNNMNEALNKFPGLGEVPVMGALFRSTEFQTDQSELMFVVTPRLVKPLTTAVTLPTDNHVVPSRGDVLLMGSGEGKAPAPVRAAAAVAPVPTPSPTVAPALVAAPARSPAPAPAATPQVVTAPAPEAIRAPAPPAAPADAPAAAPVIEPAAQAAPNASPAPVRASAIESEPIAAGEPLPKPAAQTAPTAAAEEAPAAESANPEPVASSGTAVDASN